ncbi:MAG TPA: heparan-alpha-glucosaminide N-acetyltransferase domain-containing protein [Gemmatimonadaceae bacterium]|nr:heparan-alpha-glucosaminide N-acetyltransferase domain-containing protein [Gemmatimonadaceae bacterium]
MSTVVSPTSRYTPEVSSHAVASDPASGSKRIASIDIIRGGVMVLMAIDHVRVYSGVPAGGPSPGMFFTRWITHFCAPAFIFLAGTAAFLYGEKVRDRGTLARFLLTRGAWLVLLELTVLRFGWTFNVDYGHYMLAGVIWGIGWCMILMAGLVFLPVAAVTTIGVAIIALHNVTDAYAFQLDQVLGKSGVAWLWQLVYRGGSISLGGGDDGPQLAVLYSIIPWIGVMAAGFGFGMVMRLDAARRRRICLALGGGAIAAFLVLRGFNIYGDPRPWGDAARRAFAERQAAERAAAQPNRPPVPNQPGANQPAAGAPPGRPALGGGAQRRLTPPRTPALLQFIGVNKYPASLLFLLMTLGPTILLIPLLEHARGRVANVLTVFGRVPFFYYVLHIPLIHLIFVGLSIARFGTVIPWMTANHPMFNPPPPEGYTYSLVALYAITALTVALLYFPCRWFANLKAHRRDRWLSYL